MRRLIHIMLLLLSSGMFVHAQEKKGFAHYDKITYEAWQQGNWHEVITAGREALRAGYDFYYLRMRMGIAFFSGKRYQEAIPHFRKALQFSKGDIPALRYLYYSYLLSGRDADRRALMHEMPVKLRQEAGAGKLTGVTGFSLSFDLFNNLDKETADAFAPSSLPSGNGYQSFTRQGGSGAALFTHQAGKIFSLRYGYRFLSKSRYLFLRNDDGDTELPDNTYSQHQLYMQMIFRPAEGFTVGLSVNYLNLRTLLPVTTYSGRAFLAVSSQGNWTSYLSLRKDLPFVSLYGGLGVAGLNDHNQLQTDAGLTLYPTGNLNLYLGTRITWLMQGSFSGDIQQSQEMIWSPYLGFRIARPFWAELFGTLGSLSNYQSDGGWILYNEDNPVTTGAGINLIFLVPGTRLTMTMTSSWSSATSKYYLTDNFSQGYNPIDYNMLNFKLNLQWNF